jgi:hypothetical protein
LPQDSENDNLTPGDASAAGWITMLNHNVEINRIHSGAICSEIGERLHITLIRPESNELPLTMRKQLRQLQASDEDCIRSSEEFRIRGF